jgi:hypothetical protein
MKTTKILAISGFIVMIPIIALVYTTMNSGISYNDNNSDKKIQCHNDGSNNHDIHVKMFDSQIVPKYIIGKDYKIIPVNPATTDVLVNGCTLVARAVSQ